MSQKIDKYHFKTSGLYLAAFLYAKGAVLVDVDKHSDSRRAFFVFQGVEQCQHLVNEFNFSKENSKGLLIDARKLVSCIKALKEKLYQQNF